MGEVKIDELILKFIRKCKGSILVKTIMKNYKARRLHSLTSKFIKLQYSRPWVTGTKTLEQWTRKEPTNGNTHILATDFNQDANSVQQEKSFKQVVLDTHIKKKLRQLHIKTLWLHGRTKVRLQTPIFLLRRPRPASTGSNAHTQHPESGFRRALR